MNEDQFTVDDNNVQGEQQDTIVERDDKAEVLAEDVKDREYKEKRTLLLILSASIILFVSSFSFLAYAVSKVNSVAEDNRRALCGLKGSLLEQQRLAPLLDLSPEDLKQTLDSIDDRILGLSDIDC